MFRQMLPSSGSDVEQQQQRILVLEIVRFYFLFQKWNTPAQIL